MAHLFIFLVNSESGGYLGLSSKTDNTGRASFVVPEVSYRLRVDVNGEQFWTTVINVLPGQENSYELDLSSHDLAHDPTNNPRPRRWDGEQPLYQPLLALNAGSLTGMLAQITTQTLLTEQARTFWYITDHLATAQLITDNHGTVIWQGNYKPFGEVEVVIDQLSSRFRFPGQYYDAETGLHYNWHRYYDPETGRYISADPIGLAGGMNLYAYVGGDPVNWIDPWGLATLGIHSDTTTVTGHGWISGTYDSGITTHLGNFPGGPSSTDMSRTPTASHYYDIDEDTLRKILKEVSKPGYDFDDDNCVDRVEDALDVLDVKHPSFDRFGISDPRKLEKWIKTQ